MRIPTSTDMVHKNYKLKTINLISVSQTLKLITFFNRSHSDSNMALQFPPHFL